jgi:hypothetical protein
LEWFCADCGHSHGGMFDLATFSPDPWSGQRTYQPNNALTLEGDFLSEDFCVIAGEHFMVRCVIDIPVHDFERRFGFGCWGSLSRTNFERYVAGFDNGDYGDSSPWTSWLCNNVLKLEDTQPVGCLMYPQPDRQRPILRVAIEEHPLWPMQEYGIAPEVVFNLYRLHGHSLA